MVPAAFSMSLKPRYKPDSNPILPAMLLKINMLDRITSPLSEACFLFGVSDMQVCRAPVQSVKAKTDRLGISFLSAKDEFERPALLAQ